MAFASAEYAAGTGLGTSGGPRWPGRLGVHAAISAKVPRSSSLRSSLPRRSSPVAGPLPSCTPRCKAEDLDTLHMPTARTLMANG